MNRVAQAPAPPPRWFWLLPLLALVAWWPIAPYWQSDDFVAMHYARDFGNVLRDFVGPQYGAEDIWLFYRPLIMLSFWNDQLVGGANPWFAHFSNTLAHAINTLLVGLIWLRFVSPATAFAAGALWCLQPAHAGAVLWAIGRVDSHTTVWCLLSVWFLLRHLEDHSRAHPRRRDRWLSLGAFALALCSKELGFAVPFLLLAVVMLRGEGNIRSRLGFAVRTCAPHLWLLLAYFVFRRIVLGVFVGGYSGASFEPVAMVTGLGRIVLHLLNPLLWTDGAPGTDLFAGAPVFLVWVGFAPAVLALAVLLMRRRIGGLLAGLLLFLIASLPSAPFWMDPGNVHNLRYFYLPCAALAGLCACAGRSTLLLAVLVHVPALVAIRADYVTADRQSAAMHRALKLAVLDHHGEVFAAGIPHTNARGTVMQLHFGVDRMLEPPLFGPDYMEWMALGMPLGRLYALRPFAELPTGFRLDDGGPLFALPAGPTLRPGATLRFTSPGELAQVAADTLPQLPLELTIGADLEDMQVDSHGVIDLTGDGLQRLKDAADKDAKKKLFIKIGTPGVSPQAYRVTIFTATGYLCTVIPNHAGPDAPSGHIDLRRYLAWACCTRVGPTHVLRALEVPAIHDLDPDFPVLVEAGELRDGTFNKEDRPLQGQFVPSHRARSWLRFRCDRRWPAMVRAILNA